MNDDWAELRAALAGKRTNGRAVDLMSSLIRISEIAPALLAERDRLAEENARLASLLAGVAPGDAYMLVDWITAHARDRIEKADAEREQALEEAAKVVQGKYVEEDRGLGGEALLRLSLTAAIRALKGAKP